MADREQTTIRPSADAGFWLYEYQKAITNVRGAISRGQSETATKMIDDLISRWQLGCQMEPPTWCHVTNSPCTAKIPAACLCAQMPAYLVEKLRKGETDNGAI